MKQALWIVNPCAGRKKAEGKGLSDALAVFEQQQIQSTVYMTKGRGDAVQAAAQARGYDMVVCCGGDGTLHEVLNGMLQNEQPVPLGYIPCGTTNDFAVSLGLPTDFMQAAQCIAQGTPLAIDVGSMQGQKFSYVASFGAMTKASYSAPQKAKNRLGHLAYIFAGLKDIRSIKPYPLRVRFDGQTLQEEYLFGAVTNSTSVAGLFKLAAEEVDFVDGRFEVLLVRKPRHIWQLPAILKCLLTRKYKEKYIRFFHTDGIEFESDTPLDWTLDGEYGGSHTLTAVQVLPRAVQIIKK